MACGASPLTSEDRGVLAESHREQTAARDLAALANAGVLMPHGNGRGRYYTAGEPLLEIQRRRRARREPLKDPYPWMRARLVTPGDPGAS